jgi:hypothetical protein
MDVTMLRSFKDIFDYSKKVLQVPIYINARDRQFVYEGIREVQK